MHRLQASITDSEQRGFAVFKDVLDVDESTGTGSIEFPYIKLTGSKGDSLEENYGYSSEGEFKTGQCGKYKYTNPTMHQAALALVTTLAPAASIIVEAVAELEPPAGSTNKLDAVELKPGLTLANVTDKSPSEANITGIYLPVGAMELVSAALNYQNSTHSLWATQGTTNLNETSQHYSIDQVKQLGWLFAGSYYYYIINLVAGGGINDSNSYLQLGKKFELSRDLSTALKAVDKTNRFNTKTFYISNDVFSNNSISLKEFKELHNKKLNLEKNL